MYSVTHTDGFVAIALVDDGRIGLDAERADRAAGPARSTQSHAVPGSSVADWVRHEAALKARGCGIDRLWADGHDDPTEGLHIVDLAPGAHVAALATDRPVARIRWGWWRTVKAP